MQVKTLPTRLMLGAWQCIPKHDQLELTYAWNGVGIWEV